jgi:23S rRNA pseudouridine1911/1915/1917 synthase
MPGKSFHHVTIEKTTVAEVLSKHFKLPPEKVAEMFALGAVHMDKQRVLADRPLEKGAHVLVYPSPQRFPSAENVDWKSIIVHEGAGFIIVNKPTGVPVVATPDNLLDNVLNRMRAATGKELFVTQRLDTPVSGLMVLATTEDFQKRFNAWLADGRITKRYRALISTAPKLGLHVHYMEPTEKTPVKVVAEERRGWLRCELSVIDVKPRGKWFEAQIDLHTGRTHQIRAQLAALGAAILGDKAYGAKGRYKGIALACTKIEWRGGSFALENKWQD